MSTGIEEAKQVDDQIDDANEVVDVVQDEEQSREGLIEEVEKYVQDTKRNLAALREGLARLGVETSDSVTNFVAARLGEESIHDALRTALRGKDILIRRPFREPELKEWVRISTAPPAVQSTVLEELQKILTNINSG